MIGKKMMELLLPLPAGQRTRFLKWMSAPVHNTDAGLTNLAHFYLRLAPAAAPPQKSEMPLKKALSAAELWAAIYPGKPLKEGVLRVKIRQLTQQLEDFLIWEEVQKDEHLKKRLLLQARSPHISYDHFERESLKYLKKMPDDALSSVEDYYRRMQVQSDLIRHPQFDHYQADGHYLRELDESLDAFFLLFKYRLGSEIKSRERIRGEQYEVRFQKALREEQEAGLLQENKTARLYGKLFKLQVMPEQKELLDKLKTTYLQNHQHLSPRDMENIYFSTLNHLSRQINRGGSRYYTKMLDWYQIGLDSESLLKNGKITGITFSNIALLGFRARKFEWTYQFLDDFADALEEKVRQDTLISCRATGAFYAADYRSAIDILSVHHFTPAYRLRTRLTLIRSYYELMLKAEDVYDQLDREMGRFDAFLTRNRTFSEAVKQPFRAHLRILRKMLNLHLRKQMQSAEGKALREEIVQTPAVVAKEWLLEKVIE